MPLLKSSKSFSLTETASTYISNRLYLTYTLYQNHHELKLFVIPQKLTANVDPHYLPGADLADPVQPNGQELSAPYRYRIISHVRDMR